MVEGIDEERAARWHFEFECEVEDSNYRRGIERAKMRPGPPTATTIKKKPDI